MTKIYVFPGQGSQKLGMGAELFEHFPELINQASDLLGYSIEELCTTDPNDTLNLTNFTQPMLYIVNALTYLKKTEETSEKPNFVAGHSLGEYNALFAANVFDFATGLKLVKKRGKLMSKVKGGAMAAVMGLNEVQIKKILDAANIDTIDIANYNAPNQIVLSGLERDFKDLETVLIKNGAKRFIRLKVSGAFHSRYMLEAEIAFSKYLEGIQFRQPEIPVISNFKALPYSQNISRTLAKQISNAVRWTESIQYLLRQPNPDFEEMGPGKVLTGLIRQIIKAETLSIA